jgi:hypothetical protein
MKFISLIFIIISLAGCSASGPLYSDFSPNLTGSSIIYIYRPSRAVNCCVAPAAYINGARLESLKNGGYLVYEFPAGNYEVTVGDGDYGFDPQTLKISTSAGSIHYLKWVIGSLDQFDAMIVGGYGVGYATRNYHLIEMPLDKARDEIVSLKLSKP